jgi:polysaccharide pyruvyl transferase WcaK-like protein
MNLIAPFGFYGAGNIGDESTLQGFARLLFWYHPGTHVWVASRNPAHTKRVEPSFKYFKAVGRDPFRRWAKYRSTACVFPGGTPIMDVLGQWPLSELTPLVSEAKRTRKSIVFVGTGTEVFRRDESRLIMSKLISPNVLHWTVRSSRDKERLVEYGVLDECITVAADMAWMLERVSTQFAQDYLRKLNVDTNVPLVGVNVNNEPFMLTREPRIFEKLAAFLDIIVERYGVQVLFLCNEIRDGEIFDKVASQKVLAHMKNRNRTFLLPNHYWTPQQMLSFIGCCHLTITTRYHFCLFSALQDVPFIAIKRSDKVDDLCWDMNWIYAVSLDEIDPVLMRNFYLEIEQRRQQIVTSLRATSQLLKERVLKNNCAFDVLAEALKK